LRTWFAVAVLLVSLSAEAKTKTKSKPAPKKQDPRTVGLGRSCKKRSECKSRSQVCLRMSDARGKELPKGFCALPCASLELGPATRTAPPAKPSRGADGGVASTTDAGVPSQKDGGLGAVAAAAEAANTRPATAADIKEAAKRKTASRCPPRYQCRGSGAGVPIDLCVKE
jgi:hypothetical protein